METKSLMRKILRDVTVEAAQEFDRNFERQAFFSEAWTRKKSPSKGGHILVDTGSLRRSISARSDDNSVTFSSSLPYSAIHNDGGDITVTAKMKRYFWHRYYATCGRFTRKKNGQLSGSRKQLRLSDEAEFWKRMALMKVGAKVKIPKRRFLGAAPELESSISMIIENDVKEYVEKKLQNIAKQK